MADNTPAMPAQIGRYRVVRLLGRGAMGQVLLAHDPVLDRPVAVKHLRKDLSLTSEQRVALTQRMEQEARAAARVNHPNLVALHDMGEDEQVGLFLVFEYVQGPTLRDRLERGPLTAQEAAELSEQLGGALTTAHAAGVLHRDIKPDNLILAATGAKIADFGIARLPDSTLTLPGGLLGTPAYSAPEAIDDGSFSPASDQFSMAATLFEAISGRRAFPGDDAVSVAALVQTSEPPAVASLCRLDPSVDTVLARSLAKHPGSRFASCEEFGKALAEALAPAMRRTMTTQPDLQHLRRVPVSARSRAAYGWAVVALFALAGVALASAVGVDGWASQRSAHTRDASEAQEGADDPDLHPVAFLAERPSGRKRGAPRRRSSSRARRAARAGDAGAGGGAR